MEESPREQAGGRTDLPHDDELDVEGPNESAPGHEPETDDEAHAEGEVSES